MEGQENKTMSKEVNIGTLIVRSSNVRGGRPRIAGTGGTVRRIVGWYKLGLSPEEIADRIGHISLAQVYAALAYYHANKEEIEDDIQSEEIEAEKLEHEHYLTKSKEWRSAYISMAEGKTHGGIILAKQQNYSVGEQLRRLLKLIAIKSVEEMQNQVEFLSAWGWYGIESGQKYWQFQFPFWEGLGVGFRMEDGKW